MAVIRSFLEIPRIARIRNSTPLPSLRYATAGLLGLLVARFVEPGPYACAPRAHHYPLVEPVGLTVRPTLASFTEPSLTSLGKTS